MKELLTSIRRTPYQSMASFLILFFTLFLSLFFFNITSFFNGILTYVETKPHVTAYFQKEAKESDIFKVRDIVEKSGKAISIKYVSKKEALSIYRDLNRDDPLLLEMVSADILPPSLEIYTQKPSYLAEVAAFLKRQPGVDDVFYQKDIVDKLLGVTRILRAVTLFVFLLLLSISCIVLMATTAFKITLKREQIELERLLGATRFYVKRPFLFEGMMYGIASATLAYVVFYGIFFLIQPFLTTYLVGIPSIPFYGLESWKLFIWPPSINFMTLSYLIVTVFGIAIGLLGNFLATSKYIK